jgi:phosphopantetheinyl transferase
MTTMWELMMDAARPLAAGRAIVGLAKVRALRWLAPTEAVTVTISATTDPDGHIDVVLEGYARGKVLLGDRYPAAAAPRSEALRHERQSPASARDQYEGRWLFHGPQFQGVTEVSAYGDDGIRGQLVSLAAPGGLLDNAGQLMGFWIRTSVAENKLAFPATVERLELFGPNPAPGTPLGCTVWVRSVTDTMVTADLEVRSPNGQVWARITGWADRRFLTDDAVDPMLRWPEANRIAEQQPGGWMLLRDRWPDPANRELVMRRYLASVERRQYDSESPRGRHRWLLGRMAAKDAVRQWLWDGGAGPLYPAEFVVENETTGQPFVRTLPEGVGISIAHAGELAVAFVGPGGVGIDVEVVEDRGAQFEAMACTDGERALLDACGGSHSEWLTRFWTAKEAVAKAIGTGLGGRPHRFEVDAADGPFLAVTAHDHGSQWSVETTTVTAADGTTQYAVGWTTAGASPPVAALAATRGFSPLTLVNERNFNGR